MKNEKNEQIDYADWFVQFQKWFANDIEVIDLKLSDVDAKAVFQKMLDFNIDWEIIGEYAFEKNPYAIKGFNVILNTSLNAPIETTEKALEALYLNYKSHTNFILALSILYRIPEYRKQIETKMRFNELDEAMLKRLGLVGDKK